MLWNILEKKEKTGEFHRKVAKYAKILYSLFSDEPRNYSGIKGRKTKRHNFITYSIFLTFIVALKV